MQDFPKVQSIQVVDAHTEGEPTRVVIAGAPDLGDSSVSLVERARLFNDDYSDMRSSLLGEPRGREALVGALLYPSSSDDCATEVIFFNESGNLGMCGHASIGCAVVLAYLQRIGLGKHNFVTPVGRVGVNLTNANEATVRNVPSYRYQRALRLPVPELGVVTGDVAWGGNWFFLTEDLPCSLKASNIPTLSAAANNIRAALVNAGITGAKGAEIDHIEFNAHPEDSAAQGRNFVLCPDGAYDRSPCGTGTSAKLACLAADGKLAPGETWLQESIIGSRYSASYELGADGSIVPSITGRAYVYGKGELLFDPQDPYALGIR